MGAVKTTASGFRLEAIDAPSLGTDLYIREMSADDLDAFLADSKSDKIGSGSATARVAARGVCDGEGVRKFKDDNALAKAPASLCKTLGERVLVLSGLMTADGTPADPVAQEKKD